MSDEINDIRTDKEFRGITFSKFQMSKVKTELLNNLLKGKIENSCYWGAELICSGHYMELWEIILLFCSKHIHIGNAKLPLYIDMRFDNFKQLVSSGYIGQELSLRNNDKMRRLFTELLCILCLSEKKHSFQPIKVGKEDFDMTVLAEKLKAPSVSYVQAIFVRGDPKELYISLNELTYCLESKNSIGVCYWIEWILEFDARCKKRKEKCECDRREFAHVDSKYQKELIWLVWHALLDATKDYDNLPKKVMKSLLNLYCLRFTPSAIKRRKYLLYFASSLCCETINFNKEIVNDKRVVDTVCNKIDLIYKQLKKNEVSPETDYLFNNKITGKTNLQKTVDKLDKISQMGDMIIRTE